MKPFVSDNVNVSPTVSNSSDSTLPSTVSKLLFLIHHQQSACHLLLLHLAIVNKSSVNNSPSTVSNLVNTSPSVVSMSSVNNSPSTVNKSSVNNSPSIVSKVVSSDAVVITPASQLHSPTSPVVGVASALMQQWLSALLLFQLAQSMISLVHSCGNTLILCISPGLSSTCSCFSKVVIILFALSLHVIGPHMNIFVNQVADIYLNLANIAMLL